MTTATNARPPLIDTLDKASSRRTTPVGDGELVWRIWGTGEPLVLLHGGTGSWMHWMRNIEDLSRDYTLLVPDIPGSGESASPHLPTSVDKVAAALVAGIDAILGPERRFAVAGFSMGGLISGFVTKLAGDRVTTLVLVGAVGTTAGRAEIAPMKSWRRLRSDDAKREAHRTNLSILMLHDPNAIDEPALYMQFHNAERSRVRGKHINRTGDLSNTLPSFKGRLASIWGEYDVTAGPYLYERRDRLAQLKPGASFDVIPGVGHWVQYEAADAFNQLLRQRLNGE
jgi:pimeloyl-ACP methyl ester carboxylesterase